jgi:hypothetical protein
MPRLEEVQYYLHGLWLLLRGNAEGLSWLDFSERGFWRSWWALVYCLPPMLLNWSGVRLYYLSSMPKGTVAGPDFFAKLVAVDASVWTVSYLALAVVMTIAGYSPRIAAVITTVNWLTVPLQWLSIPISLAQIFDPSDIELAFGFLIPFLVLSAAAHFLVIRRLMDGNAMPTIAIQLAMIVSSVWTSSVIGNALGVTL